MSSQKRVSRLLLALAGFGVAIAPSCGSGGGGVKSEPIVTSGTGSGPMVAQPKLTVSMSVPSAGPLADFATRAKAEFGGKVDGGSLSVVSCQITIDLENSRGGVLNYQDAFASGATLEIKLRGSGTKPGVPIGSYKGPSGGGALKIEPSFDARALNTLREDILAATPVLSVDVSGATNWNNGETKAIGLRVQFVLKATKD